VKYLALFADLKMFKMQWICRMEMISLKCNYVSSDSVEIISDEWGTLQWLIDKKDGLQNSSHKPHLITTTEGECI
jgi:hypothetical protein